MKPATITLRPNQIADMITRRWCTSPRRAPTSAPASDPMARIEPSTPYSPAPLPYTCVAISAVVIWKLNPNVPVKNTIPITSRMSGRART